MKDIRRICSAATNDHPEPAPYHTCGAKMNPSIDQRGDVTLFSLPHERISRRQSRARVSGPLFILPSSGSAGVLGSGRSPGLKSPAWPFLPLRLNVAEERI